MTRKICLASDNWAPAHPAVLQAIVEANEGVAPSYGSDPWSEEATILIQSAFKAPCKIFFTPTGTGANVLGLAIACRRHESILCTDIAHIHYQEAGATESVVGCKLLPMPHQEGKVTPSNLLKTLKRERAFGKHSTSPRVLSMTQPTEVGTMYTLEELRALSTIAQEEHLLLHIDGSRLYNAAVGLGVALHEMFQGVRLDLLSLGGTKNGLVGAEALLIFNPELQPGSDHLQKQTLQLVSKMRYLSAQYIPFFKQNLWHQLAAHANQRAQEVAQIIKATPNLELSYPVVTNQVFFSVPEAWILPIQERVLCHLWDQEKRQIRCVTSWNTSEQDIKDLKEVFADLIGDRNC